MNITMNHILMMQRNCFKIHFESILGKRLVINRNKFDWETLNTPKIKTIFYSNEWTDNDYGTKLRIKCHRRIQRKEKTIDDESCTNWNRIDSFGVELDLEGTIHRNDGYEKFYDDPSDSHNWKDQGNGL